MIYKPPLWVCASCFDKYRSEAAPSKCIECGGKVLLPVKDAARLLAEKVRP